MPRSSHGPPFGAAFFVGGFMAETLIALGNYRFSIDTASYEQLQRTDRYQWPTQQLVGKYPAAQFTGYEAPEITLQGRIFPHWNGGITQIEQMRVEAGEGKPLDLVDGMGRVWGLWSITEIRETQSAHLDNSAPRKQSFQLKLQYFGEELPYMSQDGVSDVRRRLPNG